MADAQWAKEVRDKLVRKMLPVAERNQHKVPYTTKDGVFDDRSDSEQISWWTNGFWGGILWQMYHLTGEEIYRDAAQELEIKLDADLMNWKGMDHDNGFKWLPTAVAQYRMNQNDHSLNRGILAANNLLGRFNIAGNFFRAWNDWDEVDRRGLAIIDCMMNLPLLYWASDVTGDPRFRHAAVAHANTTMTYFVRADGSVNHIMRFDPETGELIEAIGGQGYEVGSSWTRGQSWGLYGFVLSYIHTGRDEYLDTAKRIAHYVIANIPENGLIPVDYRQPNEVMWEDSTASAITACGLIELSRKTEGRDSELYLRTAIRLLKTLDKERCNWNSDIDNLLERCTAAYHDKDHEFSIIYGDYYFLEAILKLTGDEFFIW